MFLRGVRFFVELGVSSFVVVALAQPVPIVITNSRVASRELVVA